VVTHVYPPPRSSPFDPPEMLAESRARDPIHKVTLWSGAKVWLITRYEDARFVLRDSRFSADPDNGLPAMSPSRAHPGRPSMNRMDDPRHGQIRRMLADEFMAKRVRELRPRIVNIVTGRLEVLLDAAPPADFHALFSLPVPNSGSSRSAPAF
jgi:cytochrome P450